MFITFEGGEGAGKSTLALRIRDKLISSGHKVIFTREPGGTHLGEEIRSLLLHRGPTMQVGKEAELFLFLAARAQHIEEVIRPALDSGAIVLCDRFSDSTIAYQGAGKELGCDYVEACCQLVARWCEPDLTFLVDIDPTVGLARVDGRKQNNGVRDRMEQEALAFHKRVREGFLKRAQKFPERICILDGTQNKEQVFTQGYEHLLRYLRK